MGLEALSYLVGEWRDEARSGEPGTATGGGESWRVALDGQVLVREAWCEYPDSPRRATFRHEDPLVVYVDADSEVRGVFWDNEGHVIRYREVHPDPDEKGVGLVSDPSAPGPRQWLRYWFDEPERRSAVFSLHRPGAPGSSPYLRWTSVRVSNPSP